MTRIFLALALLAVLLLIANAIWGLSMGDYNGAFRNYRDARRELVELEESSAPDQERQTARKHLDAVEKQFNNIKQRKNIHFLLGVVASLVTVLVNCITITYFVGTSRWCAEVVDTYSLDMQLTRRSTALKRKSFPWAVGGMLVILGIVCLGAMSDPGVRLHTSAGYVTWHFMAALVGTTAVAWSFLVQVTNIGANFGVIAEILDEVHRVRDERGLDKPEENVAERPKVEDD